MKIIFMTEEGSMAEFLKQIIPKVLPEAVKFQIVPHNGISDLKNSIPKKLRHWSEAEEVRFMIVLDRDSRSCRTLKEEIRLLCRGTNYDFRIRIACQELEAWYFGDLEAVSKAYGKTSRNMRVRKNTEYRMRFAIQRRHLKGFFRNIVPSLTERGGLERNSV